MSDCHICFANLFEAQSQSKQIVTLRKCGHCFHQTCIQRWLDSSYSCPQCRTTNLRTDVIRIFLDGVENSGASGSSKVTEKSQEVQVQSSTSNARKSDVFYEYVWAAGSFMKPFPPNAVLAGLDHGNQSSIYVGRAVVDSHYLVVKVMPSYGKALVCWDGHEMPVQKFDILTGDNFSWITSDTAPEWAVLLGTTDLGVPLYFGRTFFNGFWIPGSVDFAKQFIHFGFDGCERLSRDFEVLITSRQWVLSSTENFQFPPNAVLGGMESESVTYVARARFGNSLIPGKLLFDQKQLVVSYKGNEVISTNFEILCLKNYAWVSSHFDGIPSNAVAGGHSDTGETLYIGRVARGNELLLGRVHPNRYGLICTWNGREIRRSSFEILVHQSK